MQVKKELIKSYQQDILRNNLPERFNSRIFSDVPFYDELGLCDFGVRPLIRDISIMIANSSIQSTPLSGFLDVISNVDKFLRISPMIRMNKIVFGGEINFPLDFLFGITSLEDDGRLCIRYYSAVQDKCNFGDNIGGKMWETDSIYSIYNYRSRFDDPFWFFRFKEEKRYYFDINNPKLVEIMCKKDPYLKNIHLLMKKLSDDDLANLIMLYLGPNANNFVLVPNKYIFTFLFEDENDYIKGMKDCNRSITDCETFIIKQRYDIAIKEYNKIIENGEFLEVFDEFSIFYIDDDFGFNGERLDSRLPILHKKN